jgi:uncharacterized sulfatase
LASPDYKAGGETQRLVSFVDFAPTVLSLAGIEAPDWMQGFAFLGKHQKEPQPFLYGFRGRMDERQDLVRSVTDGRYVYVRNYMPHLPAGQHNEYMFQTPTTRVWKKLFDEGKLTPEQAAFWKPHPAEELYDLESDPDEVKNLADDSEHGGRMAEFQRELSILQKRIIDIGLLAEGEMHRRSNGQSPYDMGRDQNRYSIEVQLMSTGGTAHPQPKNNSFSINGTSPRRGNDLEQDHAYWAGLEFLANAKNLLRANSSGITSGLKSHNVYVQLAGAEGMAHCGERADQESGLAKLLELAPCDKNDFFVSAAALQALDRLDPKLLAPHAEKIRSWPTQAPKPPHQRYDIIIPRLTESLRDKLP